MTKGRTRRPIHGSVKQMQFYVNFVALWSKRVNFLIPQNFQFYFHLCFDPHRSRSRANKDKGIGEITAGAQRATALNKSNVCPLKLA